MEASTVNVSVQFDDECVKCYSIATNRLVSDLKQLCLQDVQIVSLNFVLSETEGW